MFPQFYSSQSRVHGARTRFRGSPILFRSKSPPNSLRNVSSELDSEAYESKAGAKNGIASVQKNAARATLVALTD